MRARVALGCMSGLHEKFTSGFVHMSLELVVRYLSSLHTVRGDMQMKLTLFFLHRESSAAHHNEGLPSLRAGSSCSLSSVFHGFSC